MFLLSSWFRTAASWRDRVQTANQATFASTRGRIDGTRASAPAGMPADGDARLVRNDIERYLSLVSISTRAGIPEGHGCRRGPSAVIAVRTAIPACPAFLRAG
jgi:hypothetical protein